MKLLFLSLLILFLPAYAQNNVDEDIISHIVIDSVGIEDHVVSKLLEIPGTSIHSNGTITLNVTINAKIALEDKLSECELLNDQMDECQLIQAIYDFIEDQKEEDTEDYFFNYLSILLPVFTGIAGLYGGQYLSDRSRIKKESYELQKIRRLISLDFSRIYHLKKNMEINHKNMYDDLQQSNAFSQFIIDLNSLTSLMKYLKAGLKFYHWKTLENSASLIKLAPDEIQRLQFAYDQISGVDKNNEQAWSELAAILENSLTKITDNSKREEFFKTHVNEYFKSIFLGYSTVDYALNQLNFNWLDFDLFLKEYPKEKEEIEKFSAQNEL